MQPYEFDEQQDEVVAALARWMINVAMLTLLSGAGVFSYALIILFALHHTVPGLLGIGISVGQSVVTFMLLAAGRRLILIPRTEGEDMENLMGGLARLGTTYLVQAITYALLVAGVLFVVLA